MPTGPIGVPFTRARPPAGHPRAPRLRVRVMAALLIFGLLVFTAPIVMIPLIDWLAHQL